MVLPLTFFPAWLRDDRARAAVRLDHADADRRLAREAPRRCARRLARAPGGAGRSSCSASGGWRCALGDAEAGDPGWLTPSSLWRRLVGAQIRSQLQYRASFVLDVVRRVPDLVPRLPRRARDLPQRRAARRLERARGRVPLRDLVDLVRADRPARRALRPVPAEDPRRQLRHPARAPARHAVPGDRAPTSSCAGSARRSRALLVLVFALGSLDDPLGRRPRRDARRDDPRRDRDLRLGLGRRLLPRVLDDRRRRVHERVHLRRQLTSRSTRSTSSRRWLRRFLAYIVPLAFVCLLPGALRARQARPARPAARARVRRTARRARCRGASPGLVWRFAVRHYRSAGG